MYIGTEKYSDCSLIIDHMLYSRSKTKVASLKNYYLQVSRPSVLSSAGPPPGTSPPAPSLGLTDGGDGETSQSQEAMPFYDLPEKLTMREKVCKVVSTTSGMYFSHHSLQRYTPMGTACLEVSEW